MLYLHEVHRVRGRCEEEFEALFRDAYLGAVAEGGDARLLWYLAHAHGSGPAYQFVTVTALADGAAFERLARRVAGGDLRQWARRLDEVRHSVQGKVLVEVEWSPLQETLVLGDVPTDARTHDLSLYMEDTGWPSAALDEYTAFWETGYFRPMRQRAGTLLDVQAVFQGAHGAAPRKEAILLQRIEDDQALLHLLTHETAPERKAPGQFMYEALAYRDRWESRLLRTSAWSPLH